MREGIPDTQAQGLFNKNVGKNENDLYLKDLDKKFSLASKILAYKNANENKTTHVCIDVSFFRI